MKIYNLGSLNIDYVYKVDHFAAAGETLSSEKLSVFPGGKGLNQSVALARAGAKVLHGGILGAEGDFLIDTLSASGVDVSRIEKRDGRCGHAIIQVTGDGQNCILLFPGTNRSIDREYSEGFLHDAGPGDFLLLQNEISGLKDIFGIAHAKKMQIVFNPSPFHADLNALPLSYVKWWFCNEIEGEALFGSSDPYQIAENFISRYPDSNLILTLGSAGSIFRSADELIECPAYKADPVDTTAAGDTFTGYFIAALTGGKSVRDALDLASKAAAVTVSRPGAAESIPYFEEL